MAQLELQHQALLGLEGGEPGTEEVLADALGRRRSRRYMRCRRGAVRASSLHCPLPAGLPPCWPQQRTAPAPASAACCRPCRPSSQQKQREAEEGEEEGEEGGEEEGEGRGDEEARWAGGWGWEGKSEGSTSQATPPSLLAAGSAGPWEAQSSSVPACAFQSQPMQPARASRHCQPYATAAAAGVCATSILVLSLPPSLSLPLCRPAAATASPGKRKAAAGPEKVAATPKRRGLQVRERSGLFVPDGTDLLMVPAEKHRRQEGEGK